MEERESARFEDLLAWRSARELTARVYQITQSGQRARDFALCKQMQRAAVSTMANLAEGYERGRPGELHQFVSIAKGACAEVRSHLYAARDAGYLDDETFQSVLNQAEETARLIGGFRVWAERRKQQEKG